jgi:hypothetical protein
MPRLNSGNRDGSPESQLAERMKQISVYDLYRLSNANDNVLVDTFIRHQLVGGEPSRQTSTSPSREQITPGVAPGVKRDQSNKDEIFPITNGRNSQSTGQRYTEQF